MQLEYTQRCFANVIELKGALKRALVLCDKHSFCFEHNILTISDATGENQFNETLTVECSEDPFTISMQGQYVLDYLEVTDVDTIKIMWRGHRDPVLIEGDSFYTISPLII